MIDGREGEFAVGGPQGRHGPIAGQLIVPNLRRSFRLDWCWIPDLTVVTISSRPFGPFIYLC